MIPKTVESYARRLERQREQRRSAKAALKAEGLAERRALSRRERDEILAKTARRCHICGGKIDGPWHADHVLAHSSGGVHAADNYLPAHSLCNNYRWDYTSKEFQEILKLGVWARTQIIRRTEIGLELGEQYLAYERRRFNRRSNQ